jgi:hypothetical protein
MKSPPPALVAFPLAALLLSGCVSQGPFPSLAPRPGEGMDLTVEPVRTPPVVAGDPALQARIAELLAIARNGARDFDSAYGTASRAARTPGPQGSDRWIEAQQALSRLEASRTDTTRALAELDALRLAQADRPTSAADQEALRAALEACERIADDQQARLDALRGG